MTQLVYPGGEFGLSGDDNFWQEAYPYVSAEASTTILAGQVVSINTAGKVLQATTSVAAALCIGIAKNDIAAGASGLIVVRGHVLAAKAQGAIAAGKQVIRSGTTAGSVADAGTEDATLISGTVLGIAVAAAASSLVHLFVGKM